MIQSNEKKGGDVNVFFFLPDLVLKHSQSTVRCAHGFLNSFQMNSIFTSSNENKLKWTNKENKIRHILEFVINFRTGGIEYDTCIVYC